MPNPQWGHTNIAVGDILFPDWEVLEVTPDVIGLRNGSGAEVDVSTFQRNLNRFRAANGSKMTSDVDPAVLSASAELVEGWEVETVTDQYVQVKDSSDNREKVRTFWGQFAKFLDTYGLPHP